MNKIFKRIKWLYVFVFAFLAGVIFMYYSFFANAEKWALNEIDQHIYNGATLVSAGSILDRNGVVLASTVDGKRQYNSDETIRLATLHTVGDAEGYIATGAQTAFKSELTGYSIINGIYELKNNGDGNNINLTIDSELCALAYSAMGDNNGCVGVYNYKTGEILCVVSKPTFDITDKPDDINTDTTGKYDGVYINRFLSGVFTPGSTFKIITAASAIENISDIYTQSFTCTGKYTNSAGSTVTCSGVHGTLNFKSALNHSCNSAFADIAAQLTNDQLTATAEQLGFNSRITVDGIKVVKSYFTLDKASSIDRSWAGIGQYETLANPCHMLTVVGAIANGGTSPGPTLLMDDGSLFSKSNKDLKYMDSDLASQLNDLLRSNVTDYYGDSRFPNLSMCGKTGTAEVSGKKNHAWFVGYSQRSDFPYAVVVVLENNGNSGLAAAAPIANTVLQKALSLYVTNA